MAAAQLREELRAARLETAAQAEAHHSGFRRRASRSNMQAAPAGQCVGLFLLKAALLNTTVHAEGQASSTDTVTQLEQETARLRASLAEQSAAALAREAELLAAVAALEDDLAAAQVWRLFYCHPPCCSVF
jgi:hypothetical protein